MEDIDLQWFADDCTDCDCYCDEDCTDCDCTDCVCQVEVRENLAKALNKNQIFVSKGKDGISTPKTYGSVVRSQNIQDTHLSKVLKESMEGILDDVRSELSTALQNLQKANSQARLAFNALEG